MKIRAKLSLSIIFLFAFALGAIGYFIFDMESRQLRMRQLERESLIESMVLRAARDALIQQDDLLLLSYLKFLREQFPALVFVRVNWLQGDRVRSHLVGEKKAGAASRALKEVDPGDSSRSVALELGIDRAYFEGQINSELSRLKRDMARLFGIALILTILFSDWFARKLTRPLAALSHVAGEIGRGRLGVRLEWDSKDEVGELVQGFNRMSARLEELDAMKKDFVSSVTHELRSPLGAIESFLNLMDKKMVGGVPSDPVQFKDYFGRIKANVARLGGFINDLLDVAKIERGKMECTLKPMRIQDVAAEVTAFFEAKAVEAGVKLESRLDANLGEVHGDADRLRQVLVNLVANALKFTPKGGTIALSAEQFREGEKRFLEIAVRDSGKGMSPEDQKKLFQKFAQGKNIQAGVRGSHGTGLGLFIVRSIVEAHGGKVGVSSEPGKGSKFTFQVRMV